MQNELKYIFDPFKNEKLKEDRGISFEDVITAIETGGLRAVRPHHNPVKYPSQEVLIVELNHYIYLVPCIKQGEIYVLKTIYLSRRATAHYLNKAEE
jgi:hypothetical protein